MSFYSLLLKNFCMNKDKTIEIKSDVTRGYADPSMIIK
jgi:hypothetical protein